MGEIIHLTNLDPLWVLKCQKEMNKESGNAKFCIPHIHFLINFMALYGFFSAHRLVKHITKSISQTIKNKVQKHHKIKGDPIYKP